MIDMVMSGITVHDYAVRLKHSVNVSKSLFYIENMLQGATVVDKVKALD